MPKAAANGTKVEEPTVANASFKGWLSKMGHINTDFKRRYFMLCGERLGYFESLQTANKGKPKGTITVVKVGHVSAADPPPGVPKDKVTAAFRFDTAEKKPFIVYADSLKEKLAWLRALADAIKPGDADAHTPIEDLHRSDIKQALALPADEAEASPWRLIGEAMKLARERNVAGAKKKLEDALVRADYVESMVAHNPACLCALYELGKLMCEAGRYGEALKFFELAMVMAPETTSQQLKLQAAWCTWRQNKVGEAAQAYEEILSDDALCWQALLDRSRMHLATANWDDGQYDLTIVIGLGRTSAEIYNDRGVCYYELGQYESAVADFNEALKLNDRYCQAHTNRGNCLRKQGNNKEAMDDYARAIELDPQNPKAFNNRGALALKMGRYAEALADFEQAVALDPAYEVARKNLEVAKQRRDDVNSSMEARADMIAARAQGGKGAGIDRTATMRPGR